MFENFKKIQIEGGIIYGRNGSGKTLAWASGHRSGACDNSRIRTSNRLTVSLHTRARGNDFADTRRT